MKSLFLALIIASILINVDCKKVYNAPQDANGGIPCAACTTIIGVVEQLALFYNTTIDAALYKYCNILPNGLFRITCHQVVDLFVPIIIEGFYLKQTPDVICHTLKFCRTDPGQPECRLFPKPNKNSSIRQEKLFFLSYLKTKNIQIHFPNTKSICDEPLFKEICNFFLKSLNNHQASFDTDSDGFSEYQSLRGTNWKGKDCNDLMKQVHPGAKPIEEDRLNDSNCNGIWGVNEAGEPYENLFCKDSHQIGIAVLGDSIAAHFRLPDQWFDATQINEEVFRHFAYIFENEVDWPHLSAMTGYVQNTWPVISGNTSSFYLKLWERNKCNFRDYQNLGVNGARTGAMFTDIVRTLSRDQKNDFPLLVFYSVIGNDVCNGHPDTFDHMTKPDELYNNVLQTMQYLDTRLPNGSHVMLSGLLNGSYYYKYLAERFHPIGRLRKDVKFKDVYSFLSCLQVNPCNGWLTTNATQRNLTVQYAHELSLIIKNISQSFKFKNFDMAYMDFPFDKVISRWEASKGEAWQLFEPADGLHITQFAHATLADVLWDQVNEIKPDWLGHVNPNNPLITKIFGDQGGY